MAKNKGNRRISASDFIMTPQKRAQAYMDISDHAVGIACAAQQSGDKRPWIDIYAEEIERAKNF